jgi:hypothetical protein
VPLRLWLQFVKGPDELLQHLVVLLLLE